VIVREMLTQLPTACNKSATGMEGGSGLGWGEVERWLNQVLGLDGGREGGRAGGEVHRWLNPLLLAEPT
jgi:hypothetical protein